MVVEPAGALVVVEGCFAAGLAAGVLLEHAAATSPRQHSTTGKRRDIRVFWTMTSSRLGTEPSTFGKRVFDPAELRRRTPLVGLSLWCGGGVGRSAKCQRCLGGGSSRGGSAGGVVDTPVRGWRGWWDGSVAGHAGSDAAQRLSRLFPFVESRVAGGFASTEDLITLHVVLTPENLAVGRGGVIRRTDLIRSPMRKSGLGSTVFGATSVMPSNSVTVRTSTTTLEQPRLSGSWRHSSAATSPGPRTGQSGRPQNFARPGRRDMSTVVG